MSEQEPKRSISSKEVERLEQESVENALERLDAFNAAHPKKGTESRLAEGRPNLIRSLRSAFREHLQRRIKYKMIRNNC